MVSVGMVRVGGAIVLVEQLTPKRELADPKMLVRLQEYRFAVQQTNHDVKLEYGIARSVIAGKHRRRRENGAPYRQPERAAQ